MTIVFASYRALSKVNSEAQLTRSALIDDIKPALTPPPQLRFFRKGHGYETPTIPVWELVSTVEREGGEDISPDYEE